MTTKFVTGAQPPHDPAAEMLPDPPQKHDMLQEPDATVARYTLRTLFEERSEDVIVRGEGYLRTPNGAARRVGNRALPGLYGRLRSGPPRNRNAETAT